MKKALLLFLISIVFISCGDKDDDDNTKLNLSATSCILTADSYYKLIDIKNGSGQYLIQYSDASVADVFIRNNTLIVRALKDGESSISIIDNSGKEASVDVKVNDHMIMRTFEGNVWGVTGKSYKLKIDEKFQGGDLYFAASNNSSVASMMWNGNILEMKAEKEGMTGLLILNSSVLSDEYEIKVFDKFRLQLRTSNNSADGVIYTSENDSFSFLAMGNGDYKVKLDNPDMATLTEIVDTDTENVFINQVEIKMKALLGGETKITVTDAEGLSESISLVVRQS